MALKVPENDNGALNQKELNQNIYFALLSIRRLHAIFSITIMFMG